MVRRGRFSLLDGLPITIHGSCAASRKQGMRSLRTVTGTVASTRSRRKNSVRMCAHRKPFSRMCAVPRSGDSARPTFRFAPDVSGPSTCCSKKDSATIPVCSPFVVQDTDIVRRRWCRTKSIARRERFASCRWLRPRGAVRAFRLPAARISAICRSVSFVIVSVSTRIPAFRPRSICIRGSWIPTNRVSPSDGSRRRATTVASRARVRAWSNSSRNFASLRRRDV